VRGIRAVYLGLLFNVVIMATVTLAAVKIAQRALGLGAVSTTLVVCFVLSVGFSVLAGLWGVLVADLVQFAIAMVGVIAAARCRAFRASRWVACRASSTSSTRRPWPSSPIPSNT
jgi:SSS family solute:Na+ symporter